MKKHKNLDGVTLIEVLIVTIVISFLILLVVIFLRNQIFKANDAKRKADINRIVKALEEYEKDNDCYPSKDLLNCDPGTGLQPYLDKIPCDPVTKSSYYYEIEDSSCPSWYKTFSVLSLTTDLESMNSIGPGGQYNYCVGSPNIDCSATVNSPDGTQYYGCRNSICVPINWDSKRPGPECDPNYQNSTCYNQCSYPNNECKSW